MIFYTHTLDTSQLKEKIFHEELAKFYLKKLSLRYLTNGYLTEDLESLENLIFNPTFPLEGKITIFYSLKVIFFHVNKPWPHEGKIYKAIVKEALTKSKTKNLNFLKENERNKERLVILTKQFVDSSHSVTDLQLKMIKEVDDNYPDIKEVWIFNINEDPQANEEYSFKVRLRYSSSVHTSESLLKIFDEAKIMRLNINYESNDGEETSLKTLDEFAKKIYDLKPGYIFAFDENQLLAGFCKQFTDVLTVKREDDLKDYFNLDKEVKK